jgi:hypothetical protein
MASCIAGNAELRNNMSLHKEISFETAWLQLLKQTSGIMRAGLFLVNREMVIGDRRVYLGA